MTDRQSTHAAAQQRGQAAPPSAPAGVEEMQRRLDREESDHARTIDQRDAAEDALGRMFQAVTGRTAEWSSAWGYVDAIEEVEEHVATLAAERDQLAAALEAARRNAGMLAPPEGYALISVEVLRAWGKLDELRECCRYPKHATSQPAAPSEDVNVAGMPEFDGLLDHIYEYGTASEGVIEKANAFALAVIARYAPQQPAARPPKPTECMNGCPDRQVCDHCQWPPGPDQQPVAVDGSDAQAAEIKALRAEVERLNRILGRIVEGDGDSTLTIRAGADAFAAAREYLLRDQEEGHE